MVFTSLFRGPGTQLMTIQHFKERENTSFKFVHLIVALATNTLQPVIHKATHFFFNTECLYL